VSLEINFDGQFCTDDCWLHPVSNNTNAWRCSMRLTFAYVLLSNVVKEMFCEV